MPYQMFDFRRISILHIYSILHEHKKQNFSLQIKKQILIVV